MADDEKNSPKPLVSKHIANDTLKVTIKEPDNQGQVQILFSRKVLLPRNATLWTNVNEGA